MTPNCIEWEPGFDAMQDGPCVVLGMPEDLYHQTDRVSASMLSPWSVDEYAGDLYLENRTHEPTMDMRFGTALHARLLEPKEFFRRAIVDESIGPQSIGKMIKAEKANPDKIILANGWQESIDAIRIRIGEHPVASKLMLSQAGKAAVREVTLLWSEFLRGERILCKARLDYWHPGWECIVDVKTAADARRTEFERQVHRLWYHGKAGWYTRGVQQCGLSANPGFAWIPIERKPPYRITALQASARCIAQGWGEAAEALHRFIAYRRRSGRISTPFGAFEEETDLPTFKRVNPEIYDQYTQALDAADQPTESRTWTTNGTRTPPTRCETADNGSSPRSSKAPPENNSNHSASPPITTPTSKA